MFQTKSLHERLMQRALDTGDPTLIDDAMLAWKHFIYAYEDLLRFQAIPEDANPLCACDVQNSLPEVLEEQLM